MLNGIFETGFNKEEGVIVNIRKFPGVTSTDIMDHIKPTLRKKRDSTIIYAGTNTVTNAIIHVGTKRAY